MYRAIDANILRKVKPADIYVIALDSDNPELIIDYYDDMMWYKYRLNSPHTWVFWNMQTMVEAFGENILKRFYENTWFLGFSKSDVAKNPSEFTRLEKMAREQNDNFLKDLIS